MQLYNSKCNNCTLEERAIINILKVNPPTTQEETARKGLIERKNGKRNGEWVGKD